MNASSNYRGITLSNIFAQLFESALRMKFSGFLSSSELQFGFKKGVSTSHAMYCLKQCINYYTSRGSNVFVAFMDMTKAFDTISHYGLFLKLMKKGVPICFLNLIIYWYLNMSVSCKWGQTRSEEFDVSSGTKQGGVLSPDLFALYIDELFGLLISSGVGCHIASIFLACILFADDVALAAPSRSALQKLIDISVNFCRDNCLRFNPGKMKIVVFGGGHAQTGNFAGLKIDGTSVAYSENVRYLGFYLKSGKKCCFSSAEDLASFHRASNSIVRSMKRPNEVVLTHLLYSNCVSILSYGSEVKEFTQKEFLDLNTAVNLYIRRIFSFAHWQSTRFIRENLGYRSLTEIFQTARDRFRRALPFSSNTVLKQLYDLCDDCEVN